MSSASLSLGFSSSSANKDNMNSNNTANGGLSNNSNGERGGGGASGNLGSGDWIRRANGTSNTTNATNTTSSNSSSTHRRPSLSTTLTHNHNHSAAPLSSSNANVYHPPHHFASSSNPPTNTQYKYPRDQLLGIFKNMDADKGTALNKVEALLGEWASSPGGSEAGGAANWSRPSENEGAEVCWDKEGTQKPIALKEMDEAEKELFSGNVNSPQKAIQQNQSQQNTPQGNRTGGNPGSKSTNRRGGDLDISTASPIRPTNRRRETLETPGTSSPLHSSPGGPGTLSRRRTDGRANIGDVFDSPSESRHHNFSRWSHKEDSEEPKERETTKDATGGRTGGLFRRPSAAWGGSASATLATTTMGSFGATTPGGGMGSFSLLKEKKSQNLNSQKQKADEDSSEKGSSNSQAQQQKQDFQQDNRPTTSDTDPFGRATESPSPANGAGRPDDSQSNNSDQLNKGGSSSTAAAKLREEMGFSSIGRTGNFGGLGSLNTQFNQMNLGQQGQELQRGHEHDPISPTETNPYQSPVPGKEDDDDNDHGLGSIGGGIRRGLGGIPLNDHATPNRGGMKTPGTGLGGIGLSSVNNQPLTSVASSSVWGTPGSGIGTPLGGMDRLGGGSAGMGLGGSGFFGGLGDLSSPGGGMLGNSAFGSAGRASRLGSLFPVEQQTPHPHQEDDQHNLGRMDRSDSFDSLRLGTMSAGLGGNNGRRAFGSLATGGIDSPLRERGDLQPDLFGPLSSTRGLTGLGPSENPLFSNVGGLQLDQRTDPIMHQPILHQTPSQSNLTRLSGLSQSSVGTSMTPNSTNTPMPLQQHILVMPDKIQWEYRDPTGTTQGPFTGLEMHEWYKAGFFTSELLVRRADGSDFEALGTLIRKIGNSREPFLVPLPALSPANPTVTLPSNTPWGSTAAGVITSGWLDAQNNTAVQPPFPGNFPSFGTTLTAEQQNALERRKQEEQYLMARQREFLIQQQKMVLATYQQQQQLHHQQSAQSLHSQPSLGSLQGAAQNVFPAATPGTGQPQASLDQALYRQASAAGLSDIFNAGGPIGEHDLQAMQYVINQQQVAQQAQQQQQVQQQAQQQQAQQQHLQQQQQQHISPPAFQQQQQAPEPEPQQQFQYEQAQQQTQAPAPAQQETVEVNEYANETSEQEEVPEPQVEAPKPVVEQAPAPQPKSPWAAVDPVNTKAPTPTPENKSKNTSPKALQFEKRGWNEEPSSGLPAPFPPPPSAVKSDNAPGTPKPETPSASIAPWAKELSEASVPKGPSLKEIQDAEAKQAAAEEAALAEQRRQQLAQQVAAAQSAEGSAAAPGLPSTSTWGNLSPNPGANAPSAWAKPLQKPVAPTAKKTLSQIQKEEEARKAKAAAAAAAAVTTASAASVGTGKRYADLAGKSVQPVGAGPLPGGAWTTVGPGGKSKAALAPAALANSVNRPPLAPATSLGLAKPKPAPTKPAANVNAANDEFHKWCRASLKGLNNQVNVEEFISSLLSFPADAELIADSVYASSTLIDGRRFAEEFIRRRKAANAGQVLEAGAGLPNIGGASASDKVGGWNEVAKKSNAGHVPRDVPETNSAFKVVPGKKRGKK